MRTIIAIDPGKTGALAWRDAAGTVRVIRFQHEPPAMAVRMVVETGPVDLVAYVEEITGQISGVEARHSMFKMGCAFGEALGALTALKVPTRFVRPAKWQSPYSGVRKKQGQEKKRLLKTHAIRLFPQLPKVTLQEADALVLLDWATQMEGVDPVFSPQP